MNKIWRKLLAGSLAAMMLVTSVTPALADRGEIVDGWDMDSLPPMDSEAEVFEIQNDDITLAELERLPQDTTPLQNPQEIILDDKMDGTLVPADELQKIDESSLESGYEIENTDDAEGRDPTALWYLWEKYQVVSSTQYTNPSWGSWQYQGRTTSAWTGRATMYFSPSNGFSYSGTSKTVSRNSPGVIYYGNNRTAYAKQINRDGSEYICTKTNSVTTSRQRGSYVGTIKNTSSNAFPYNGVANNGYWYVYKGTQEDTVKPNVTLNSFSVPKVGQSVTISGSASTPCYEMFAYYTYGGTTYTLGTVNSSYYSKTFTPRQAGSYTLTLYARSYPTSDSRTGLSSRTVSFTVSQPAPTTYTINYYGNGGAGSTAAQSGTAGSNVRLQNNGFSRSGHTFLGWSTNSSSTTATYSAGSTIQLNSNLNLFAVWRANAASGDVTVGTQTINMSQDYAFRPNTTALYEFVISGATGASLQIGGIAKDENPYRTSLKAVSATGRYVVRVNPGTGTGGRANLTIRRGGDATTATNAQLQTDYWYGSSVTLNTSELDDVYRGHLQTAADKVNTTDFNVALSATNGYSVNTYSNAKDGKLAFVTTSAPGNLPAGNVWKPVSSGSLSINTNLIVSHDIGRVLTHELGHMAGLRDLKNSTYGQSAMDISYSNWLMWGSDINDYTRSDFMTSEVEAINQKANSNNSNNRSTAFNSAEYKYNESLNTFDSSNDMSDAVNQNMINYVDVLYEDNDLPSAIDNSDYIVTGKVVSVGETETDGIDVYRIATIHVDENIKGVTLNEVKLKMLGGNLAGQVYEYINSENYNIGDTIAVLLKDPSANENGVYTMNNAPECYVTGGEYSYNIGRQIRSGEAGIVEIIKAELAALEN